MGVVQTQILTLITWMVLVLLMEAILGDTSGLLLQLTMMILDRHLDLATVSPVALNYMWQSCDYHMTPH